MDSILIDGNTYVTPKGGDIFNSPLKRDSEANADLHPEWILSHNSKPRRRWSALTVWLGVVSILTLSNMASYKWLLLRIRVVIKLWKEGRFKERFLMEPDNQI